MWTYLVYISRKKEMIMTQGETQMQTQGADGWSLTIFINPKEVGKRMAMDRQKVKTRFNHKDQGGFPMPRKEGHLLVDG